MPVVTNWTAGTKTSLHTNQPVDKCVGRWAGAGGEGGSKHPQEIHLPVLQPAAAAVGRALE